MNAVTTTNVNQKSFVFYKGILESSLNEKPHDQLIVGSITTDIREALMWKERISSNKRKDGKTRHVKSGKSVIIKIEVPIEIVNQFGNQDVFQQSGVSEHSRPNCWMNAVKSKAQINQTNSACGIKTTVLTDNDIDMIKLGIIRHN